MQSPKQILLKAGPVLKLAPFLEAEVKTWLKETEAQASI